MTTYEVKEAMNTNLRMEDLLNHFMGVEAQPGTSIPCPFHNDSRPSAVFHSDNSIFCFACHKTYRPYDLLIHIGWSEEKVKMKAERLTGETQQAAPEINRLNWIFDVALQARREKLTILETAMLFYKRMNDEASVPNPSDGDNQGRNMEIQRQVPPS